WPVKGKEDVSQTIYSCLCAATELSGAKAVMGPDREPTTFQGLLPQIQRTVEYLNRNGIGRGDKVAIVLRNGPDAATCCLSVASGAISAPLNPGYTAAEFESYLGDLNPKALVVEKGSKSTAVSVAQGLGIPVIWLVSNAEGLAGSF